MLQLLRRWRIRSVRVDEATQLMQRLQMYLDAYTKSFAVLSNILKRISGDC